MFSFFIVFPVQKLFLFPCSLFLSEARACFLVIFFAATKMQLNCTVTASPRVSDVTDEQKISFFQRREFTAEQRYRLEADGFIDANFEKNVEISERAKTFY